MVGANFYAFCNYVGVCKLREENNKLFTWFAFSALTVEASGVRGVFDVTDV